VTDDDDRGPGGVDAARPIIDPIPDVDEDRLVRLLLRAESNAHRLGFDHPPQLHVLYDTSADDGETHTLFHQLMGRNPRCGPATLCDGYAAQIIFPPERIPEAGAPWEALETFAFNIAFADPGPEEVDTMRAVLTRPGVFGCAFINPGWAFRTDDRAEFEQFGLGKLSPADHPKGVENRMVFAVLASGAIHIVERVRGRKPVTGRGDGLRGSVSNALRLLMDGLTGRQPRTQEEYDLRYRSLRETVAAAQHVRACVQRALIYVDRGRHDLAASSFLSDLSKFDGDRAALVEFDPPAIAAAFPEGRAAVLAVCERVSLGMAEKTQPA
jgi:hypothetical protein